MEAQQQFDKIEAYLAGELTGSTLIAFEEEIKTDAALATIIEEHRVAHDAIEMLVEADLRKELDLLRTEAATPIAVKPSKVVQLPKKEIVATSTTTTAKRRSLFPRLAAAASVILLLGFFGLQFNNSSLTVEERIERFQMPESNRNGSITDLHPLSTGLDAFKVGKYMEAISYYKSIATNDKRYNEAQFYLGHNYAKVKDFPAAIAAFEKVVKSQDIRFMEQAEWFQLLTLLANKQQDDTFKSLLNKMINDEGHSYHLKAQELNSDL